MWAICSAPPPSHFILATGLNLKTSKGKTWSRGTDSKSIVSVCFFSLSVLFPCAPGSPFVKTKEETTSVYTLGRSD